MHTFQCLFSYLDSLTITYDIKICLYEVYKKKISKSNE